jgi:hypothetical protein
MSALFAGDCIGKAVNVEFGEDNQGRPRVRWEMEVLEGPHTGKRAKYSGKLDPENIKWTKRDMIAIGWVGKSVKTFVADAMAASQAGRKVPFTAEIAEHNGSTWTSAKMNGALPLGKVADSKVAEVDRWFAEAGEAGGGDNGIPF